MRSIVKYIEKYFLSAVVVVLFIVGCGVTKPSESPTLASAKLGHNPMPTSCDKCHQKDMPGANQRTPRNSAKISKAFFHDTKFIAGQDCVACHSNPAMAGASYGGAKFKHEAEAMKNCKSCHADDIPGATEASPRKFAKISDLFFHEDKIIGQQDCVACHSNSEKAGVSFTGAKLKHDPISLVSCSECHQDDMPAETQVTPPPGKISILSDPDNQFYHTKNFVAGLDCVKCHVANMGQSWSGGKYSHLDPAGGLVSTCKDCHTGIAVREHQGHYSYLSYKTPDCKSCHFKSSVNGNKVKLIWDNPDSGG